MKQINYSIIIPHKNSPQLLQRSIDSVPKREDVQIIVVDDNSDPSIVDFDHFPGMDNPQVEVYYTKEGKGAGYARNVGMQHVHGKWLILLDADDYFLPAITQLMDQYVDAEADVIFFKFSAICDPSGKPSTRGDYMNEQVDVALRTDDFTEIFLCSNGAGKIFNVAFLRKYGILFNEVQWGNDVGFMARVAYSAQSWLATDIHGHMITESDARKSLVQAVSLESKVCRLKEEAMGTSIVRKRYGHAESIYFWLFNTWKNVYKISRWKGLCYIPFTIYHGGCRMLYYYLRFMLHPLKCMLCKKK